MKIKLRSRNVLVRPVFYNETENTLYFNLPTNPIKFIKYSIKYPMMYWVNKRFRTLMCECGHHFDEHHHGIICNINATYLPIQVRGTLGQECEHNGFNGVQEPDEDGNICYCGKYDDIGWVFKLNKNYKYRLNLQPIIKKITENHELTNSNRTNISSRDKQATGRYNKGPIA